MESSMLDELGTIFDTSKIVFEETQLEEEESNIKNIMVSFIENEQESKNKYFEKKVELQKVRSYYSIHSIRLKQYMENHLKFSPDQKENINGSPINLDVMNIPTRDS